jgi:GDP-mannose 6-dehydrogenase
MHAGMLESNRQQVELLAKRIIATSGRQTVGIVGLAFKEGTDDVRESPMVALAEQLLGKGIPIRIYDEHLAVANMVGSNRQFILEAIPHLADLLSHDLQEVAGASRTLVVNHRLSVEKWRSAPIGPDHQVLDLVNVAELRGMPNYSGLYW